MAPRVMVIEDEPAIAQAMGRTLTEDGCTVALAGSAEEGLARLETEPFDLLVLDLMLPGRSGWDVLDRVRRRLQTLLVLMVTARDGVNDRVRALREGADDYLVKPFVQAELSARVQALLRRGRASPLVRLALADLVVDLADRSVQRAGRPVELTLREFDLLVLLLRHAERPVSRDMLARDVWQQMQRSTPLDNLIDVHVANLRRKLEEGGAPRLVHTVRGIGFTASEREP